MLQATRTHLARRLLASTLRRPHRELPLLLCPSSSSSPTAAAHRAPAYRLNSKLVARTALDARRTFSSTTTPRALFLKPFVLADIGEGITEVEVVKW